MGLDNSQDVLDGVAAAYIRPLFAEDRTSTEKNLNLRACRELSSKQ